MMTTVNQGMSVEEIEQVVAQRVGNAIEAIAIYETKTSMAKFHVRAEGSPLKTSSYSTLSSIRRIQFTEYGVLSYLTVFFPTKILQLKLARPPTITNEEYIRLEEEKARRRGKVYNWETATYGKIWDNEDVHDLRSVETEFPAIVFNDTLTSKATLSCEPTVSSLNNDKLDFRISFDESDDEDCMVIFDKKSFSYKIISINDLKTDTENDNDKVNMPLLPSPEPTVSCFDLDFNDFKNEFLAIVYNDAQTSKLDFLTEPTLSPQHIDEFNLKDETSLSECDEKEQNVLYFNDLFPFNVIYPDNSQSDKDNDDDKIDFKQSLGVIFSIRRIQTQWIRRIDYLDVIQSLFFSTVDTAYSLNEYSVFDTGPREEKSTNVGGVFTNMEILKCWSLETSRRLFNT
ncbi:hypothetical protein Tco_1176281 [Tanacetum coccineum]